MPDAYENYMTFAHQMQKLRGISLTTPREISYFTYEYDSRTMSTGSFSPSSMESLGLHQMETCDSMSTTEVFEMIGNPISSNEIALCDRTEIKIVVQPVDKFRFRYKSEMMGTHGSLLGEREDSSHKKEVPTVKLVNCPVKNAVIRCSLVTADEDRRFPHAHHLVRKDENGDKDDPHDIKVSDENDYTAMFCNMGIIHTAKKNIKEEIVRKRKIEKIEEKRRQNQENPIITTKEDLEMKNEAEKAQKWMNLNSVCLCFQGFCYNENDVLYPLTEKIYSRPINNLKSALTGELKICRIDKHTSSCDGNEEVWLLVEKVGRKNIKVKFYELDDSENIIWEAEGRFSELDVHHQYAIVFRTPPYKTTNITEPVEVYLKLERPSDGEVSNSMKFLYKPSEKNLSRKRPRPSSISTSMEFTPMVTPADQLLTNCLSNTFLLPDEISNVSQELKKLLNECDNGNAIDVKKFINDNESGLESLLQIYSKEKDVESYDSIVPDGLTSKQMIKPQEFAVETMKQIITVYNEMEKNGKSESLMMNIKDLLQETINFGDTALHVALRMGQFETAKCILTCIAMDSMFKSTVDLQNSTGKTPLHLAVLADQSEIVRALLKIGANPNICDEEDATSLHSAVKVDAHGSLAELLQSGNKICLDAHTESGWSALHLAAKAGSLYAVKALHEAGADVNSKDMSYGRTALHIAVDSNHFHIVNYLLTKTNINVNEKNFGGNTALHSAVVKGGKYAEELIRLLKNHGADPNIRNNNATREEEEEDHNSIPLSIPSAMDESTIATPTIKSENSDTDEDMSRDGESSFDLARDDPKLMQLLSQHQKPQIPLEEELDLKEESEDEMPLLERSMLRINRSSSKEPTTPTPTITKLTSQQQLQLQQMRQGDEKVTDVHIERIKDILDRTGGWERLAQHTKNASLVRLHRKTSSPSSALFNKIRLQKPNLTVSQLKKLLIEVQAYEAATALDPK
ncbi:nuclear factor NF-kappa-B p100 subunit-like isoform X2 [Phymastichus coffea]|uniref:nuclear factor NF-kappa-B p100 subunit-like isoform X2 n=1 Tax=Phymastichus coffea TaxID=108790 RepID=UPI00273A8293|nr:nuclear factor NF-kappa-B p100 subunit-like isoform X2 [Phymastichus coffea]